MSNKFLDKNGLQTLLTHIDNRIVQRIAQSGSGGGPGSSGTVPYDIIIGSTSNGDTLDTVDYLCDGTNDSDVFNYVLNNLDYISFYNPKKIYVKHGTYIFKETIEANNILGSINLEFEKGCTFKCFYQLENIFNIGIFRYDINFNQNSIVLINNDGSNYTGSVKGETFFNSTPFVATIKNLTVVDYTTGIKMRTILEPDMGNGQDYSEFFDSLSISIDNCTFKDCTIGIDLESSKTEVKNCKGIDNSFFILNVGCHNRIYNNFSFNNITGIYEYSLDFDDDDPKLNFIHHNVYTDNYIYRTDNFEAEGSNSIVLTGNYSEVDTIGCFKEPLDVSTDIHNISESTNIIRHKNNNDNNGGGNSNNEIKIVAINCPITYLVSSEYDDGIYYNSIRVNLSDIENYDFKNGYLLGLYILPLNDEGNIDIDNDELIKLEGALKPFIASGLIEYQETFIEETNSVHIAQINTFDQEWQDSLINDFFPLYAPVIMYVERNIDRILEYSGVIPNDD